MEIAELAPRVAGTHAQLETGDRARACFQFPALAQHERRAEDGDVRRNRRPLDLIVSDAIDDLLSRQAHWQCS